MLGGIWNLHEFGKLLPKYTHLLGIFFAWKRATLQSCINRRLQKPRRSSRQCMLDVPKIRTKKYGARQQQHCGMLYL